MLDIISRTYCKNVHVVQTCCRAISAMQEDRSFCSFREIINIVRGENSDKRQNIAKAHYQNFLQNSVISSILLTLRFRDVFRVSL